MPAKLKQSIHFECFGRFGEKLAKPSGKCYMQQGSHTKLRKSLTSEALVTFENNLKQIREWTIIVGMSRAAKRAARAASTSLVDPMV